LVKDIKKYGIGLGVSLIYDNILNVIQDCNIVSLSGTSDYASITILKGYDSWIINNNIGSTYANLRLEGGPFRVLGNHLNGNKDIDQPKSNIVSEWGMTSTIISENIIENSRENSIHMKRIYNSDDGFAHNNVSITNNLIRSENLTTNNTYAMIKVEPVSGTQPFKNLLISNNIFEHRVKTPLSYNKYKNILSLSYVTDIVFASNIIGLDYLADNTIYRSNVVNMQVYGNSNQHYTNFLANKLEVNGDLTAVGNTFRLTNSITMNNSSDSGFQGEIRYDNNYIYIFTPNGLWRRLPIPTETWGGGGSGDKD